MKSIKTTDFSNWLLVKISTNQWKEPDLFFLNRSFSLPEIQALVLALSRNSHITSLYMNFCTIDDKKAIALAKLADCKSSPITVLDLESNSIGSEGAKALARIPLRSLYLSQNLIRNDGVLQAFAESKTLCELDLQSNFISEDEMYGAVQQHIRDNNIKRHIQSAPQEAAFLNSIGYPVIQWGIYNPRRPLIKEGIVPAKSKDHSPWFHV